MMGMQRRIMSRLRNLEVAQGGANIAPMEQGFDMPSNAVAQALNTRAVFRQLNARLLGPSFHKELDTFHEFWVLILWKLFSVLMASMDSESYAGLHSEGNISGSAVRNRVIPQSTASSRSPAYLLLVQKTRSTTPKGEVLHRAPVSTLPCPKL
ncbi:unnamed protein product [Schistocephalus solidus]|uniref:Uncharacterized protein n=1 Tax=Schistocephalus solidus TaxID=70667 RepID=A0A183TF61_SCHSO|nr:unnamed protein product [Schistocephalus solidus]